jgi:hypothetical protein
MAGRPDESTSKVDALNAAAFVTFLRDERAPAPMTDLCVGIPHPRDLPGDILDPSAVYRKPDGGMELSFPAEWLLNPARVRWTGKPVALGQQADEKAGPQSIDLLRDRIRERLPYGDVSLSSIARYAGLSERSLQR